MALQGSGTISIGDIATEFEDTAPHSLSEFYGVATGIPASGVISVSDFYGASGSTPVNLTISANTTSGYNLLTAAQSAGYVAGSSTITLTINSGVYVGSPASGASYAITISGFTSGDVISIVNNGYIYGRGGDGGQGGGTVNANAVGLPGDTGGRAIYTDFATSITNNGIIAGGGGGGGGGGLYWNGNIKSSTYAGGGGGGGGQGYGNSSGGLGGDVAVYDGLAGTGGTATAAGSGGSGGLTNAGYGGNGGSLGSTGNAGTAGTGGSSFAGGAGGAAGYYIVGNSYVTWDTTGTVYGSAA